VEAEEYAESCIALWWQRLRQYTPDEVDAKHFENVVHTSSQFKVGFAVQGFETVAIHKIIILVGLTQRTYQQFGLPKLAEFQPACNGY